MDGGYDTLTGAEALARHAGEAADVLDGLAAAVVISPTLTTAVRRTCGATLHLPSLPLPGATADEDDERVAVAERFAEQFSLDVKATDDALRSEASGAFGTDLFALAQATYVADMIPRVRSILDHLFSPGSWGTQLVSEPVDDVWPSIDRFTVIVWNMGAIDPVTAEIVRLRGARQHHCRLCMSLRAISALEAGAEEESFELIDRDWTQLTDRQQAALGFADALIWEPSRPGAEVVAAVREHFTPEQAVELTLDVMRNAANKIAVSLGADEARVSVGVDVYDIDPDGTMRQGLTAP